MAPTFVMLRMPKPTNGSEQMTTVTQFKLKSVMYQRMGMLSYLKDVVNDNQNYMKNKDNEQ